MTRRKFRVFLVELSGAEREIEVDQILPTLEFAVLPTPSLRELLDGPGPLPPLAAGPSVRRAILAEFFGSRAVYREVE